MKKLNVTKERFEKSRYFTKKYGNLEYVSESGKMFKTNKGKVLMFKESDEDNIPCPSCKGTNIDIDSDGNATCLDCDYSWELKDYTESIGDISTPKQEEYAESTKKFKESHKADKAHTCPRCGFTGCTVDDLDILKGDCKEGGTFDASFYCDQCGGTYNVTFGLSIQDIYDTSNDENLDIDLPDSELEDDDL